MGFSFLFNSPDDAPRLTQFQQLHPADGTEAHRTGLIAGFMFMQIFGGHLGIPLVILTAIFSKNVQRHPMLINFCVTWFLYATAFTLLLYAGKQTGPEPSIQLCIIQSAFIYGAPVMTSMAGLAFVLHLWFSLHLQKGNRIERRRFILLLASPYLLFLGFSVAMIVLGSLYSQTVSRSRYLFYCTINISAVNSVPATSAFIMGLVLIFEVLIGVKLYRHNKAFKSLDRTGHGGPPRHLIMRVGIFSAYSLVALIGCIGFWASTGGNLPYMIQASLPTAAFLIFGTQYDMLQVWGVVAATSFIARPFSRFFPSKKPLTVSRVQLSAGTDLRRQDTIDSMPPDLPEKDTVLEIQHEKSVQIV
ncbi:hypothetical protein B0H17DRAFT_1046755 [Mycena rosella]|uniref:Uncharacterized protein n=1 Tax=Mycena rosella TaxID=1033263 RepID=A0AAD7DWI1_MYCRO|nr:hypothetical protein B0H17DRAFT_1046755 [Mycena rosella]